MSDLKIVLVPRELFYHEAAYVRGLEQALVEAHAILVNNGGHWHGNEQRILLVERIETLMKKVEP